MTTPTSDAPSSPAFVVSERDMVGALAILERSDTDPDILMVLSDEEILALDGEDSLRILGSPYLDQEAVHRETAGATAMRGLIARRLVNPTDQAREDEGELLIGDGDPADRLIQLELGLAGILTLRRIPEAMLTIERVASEVRTVLGLHFFPGGVLEEFVAADGFHHFCVPTREALPTRLAEFLDPHGCAGEDGDVEETTLASLSDAEGLEDTRALSTLTAVSDQGTRRATVFALSDRLRVVDNGTEDPAEAQPEDLLAISDVSSSTLEEIIAALLPESPDLEDEAADA